MQTAPSCTFLIPIIYEPPQYPSHPPWGSTSACVPLLLADGVTSQQSELREFPGDLDTKKHGVGRACAPATMPIADNRYWHLFRRVQTGLHQLLAACTPLNHPVDFPWAHSRRDTHKAVFFSFVFLLSPDPKTYNFEPAVYPLLPLGLSCNVLLRASPYASPNERCAAPKTGEVGVPCGDIAGMPFCRFRAPTRLFSVCLFSLFSPSYLHFKCTGGPAGSEAVSACGTFLAPTLTPGSSGI